MSGLLLVGVVLIWLWVAIVIARMLTSKLADSWVKSLATLLAIAVIILLPVADEILGRFQFRELCSQGTAPIYDEAKVQGRTVVYFGFPRQVENTIVPISEHTSAWYDSATNEKLLSYKEYRAKGGWLSRAIEFPQGSPPYTFNGFCSSQEAILLFDRLNIKKLSK